MTTNPYQSPENRSDLPRQPKAGPGFPFRLVAIIGLGILVIGFFLLPMRRCAREAARRMQCTNHLKQIGLALHNYADTYGALPPAYTIDADGKPLHSWRTLILPFMENKPLYDRIDFTKPWDDPANNFAVESYPQMFQCPSGSLHRGKTTYFAVVAPGGCFKLTESTPFSAITDGTSNTLMVVEVPEKYAAHWMSPTDATEAMILDRHQSTKFSHPSGSQAVFVDGRTGLVTKDIPGEVLRALISIAGNDNDVADRFYKTAPTRAGTKANKR